MDQSEIVSESHRKVATELLPDEIPADEEPVEDFGYTKSLTWHTHLGRLGGLELLNSVKKPAFLRRRRPTHWQYAKDMKETFYINLV